MHTPLLILINLQNIIVDIDDEEEVDEDVLQEEDMIRQSFSPESPIVMYQLRKEVSGILRERII